MSEEQFLKATVRQIDILKEFHENYFQRNLIEVVNMIYGSDGEGKKEEVSEVESFSDLF